MNPFDGMRGLTKNPLGIIAIFLGVLYGVAGLLLGADARPLSDFNQTLLTILVCVFPFVSLGVFGWLVSRHHTKLYAPKDYRSDRSFLDSLQSVTPEEREQKLDLEADALQIGPTPSEVAPEAKQSRKTGKAAADTSLLETSEDRREKIRSTETLILNKLASEFPAIRRGAKLSSRAGNDLIFDAVALSGPDPVVIEIMALKFASSLGIRSKDVALQFASVAPTFPDGVNVKYLLCVAWLEGRPAGASRRLVELKATFENVGLKNVEIREFSADNIDVGGKITEI